MIHRNEHITTSIVPSTVQYYTLPGEDVLDFKAICCFVATGFFLDDDTYYVNQKAFQPATSYFFDEQGNITKKEPHFQWHYSPRSITFLQAVDEFSHLFENVVRNSIENKKVILSISGGLDSRTLAAALVGRKDVYAYSYEFENGIMENSYGKSIAEVCGYPFSGYTIPEGYLWKSIEKTAQINGCYSDFTNPRQVAVLDMLKDKGDTFLLGHWGDVLFDDMRIDSTIHFDEQVASVKKKILKKGGAELAQNLWQAWGLTGNFMDFFDERIRMLLNDIPIDDANARIRAFKSLHWATRWTSNNLTFFKSIHDIHVPYYDDEMCKFICTVPENFLAGRRMQIEYLKQRAPKLAAIPWQKYDPCNLFTFKNYYTLPYFPYRAIRKIGNEIRKVVGEKKITSNWQLQFLGKENEANLKYWLFENPAFSDLIPRKLVDPFYNKFKMENSQYHHAINMLLTISLFSRLKNQNIRVN